MKKNIILTLANLIICVSLFSQMPTLGLVGYYPFSGNTNDLSTISNHGVNSGAVLTTDRFGNTNNAYNFNGSSCILVPNNAAQNPSNMVSISVWVQTTYSHTNAGIVGKWNVLGGTSGGTEQYVLVANSTGVNLALNTSKIYTLAENSVTYNNGNWHHYCGVWDGSTYKLYRDGVLSSSVAHSGSIPSFNQNLEIGRYAGGLFSYLYFTGKIDDVRIYNRGLSATEVTTLFNEPNPAFSNNLTPGSVHSYKKFTSTTGNLPFPLTNEDYFGWNIENIGDINHDSINDMAIAYGHSSYNGYTKAGCVLICLMDTDKTIKSYTRIGKNSGGFTAPIGNNSYFGGCVANIGDRNGDGINDILVGSETSNLCYVIYLDTNGSVKSYFNIGANQGGMGAVAGYFGTGATSIGDIDKDGISDVAISAYSGYVYLCRLNANGSVKAYTTLDGYSVTTSPNGFGISVDDIGDIDKNGITDIVVGSYYENASSGAAYIIKIDTNFTIKSYTKIASNTTNFTTINAGFYFGGRVAGAGDLNDDGINDVLISSMVDDNGVSYSNQGALYSIFLDANANVKSYYKINNSSTNFINAIPSPANFGSAISVLGDLNHDGIIEVGVGATTIGDGGLSRGGMYILSINSNVTGTFSKNDVSCFGYNTGSATFNATRGRTPYNYLWNNGNTSKTINNLIAGTYSVTVTDALNDTTVKSITITQPPLNITTASSDVSVCSGACTSISVSGVGGVGNKTYYWNNGLGTGTSKTVCPTNTTTYTVFQKDTNNCLSIPDTVIVTATPLPNASFSGLAPHYCINSSTVSLTGSPVGGSFSGTGIAGNIFNPFGAGVGNYNITYSVTVNGCTDTVSHPVIVHALPNVVLSGMGYNYCKNAAPITMIGTPSGGLFTGNGVSGTTFTPILANTGNNIITYTYGDMYGCAAQDTQLVNIINPPTANAGANQLLVPGNTITLSGSASNGSGNYSYSWTPADSFYFPNVQNATTKPLYGANQFILTINDLTSSCQGKDTMIVGISTIPTSSTSAIVPSTICNGTSAQITSNASGGIGVYTYSWSSIPSGFSSALANPVVSPSVSTTYILAVTDGFSIDHDTVSVIVNPKHIFNLGNDTVLCGNTTLSLNAGVGATTYVWSTGYVGQILTVNTTSLANGSYQYIVITTNSFGCNSKDTLNVQVSHITPVTIGNDTSICQGSTISFNAGNGFSSYLWSNGSTTQTSTYSGLASGVYPISVKAYNSLGCSISDTLQLTIQAKPIVNLGQDTLLCGISNLLLNAGAGGINYAWSTGNTSQFQLINGSSYSPGTYLFNVLVTGANNCKSKDTIAVTFSHILDIEMGNDTSICKTQVLNLNAGSGYLSYVWSNGATVQSIVVDSLIGLGPHVIHVRANDAFGCWAMDTIVVTINECIGIAENDGMEEIIIFPNPSNGIFYIQAQNIESIEVADISGKIVRRIKNPNTENGLIKIDLGKLEKGVYLLKLNGRNFNQTEKIIIQ